MQMQKKVNFETLLACWQGMQKQRFHSNLKTNNVSLSLTSKYLIKITCSANVEISLNFEKQRSANGEISCKIASKR